MNKYRNNLATKKKKKKTVYDAVPAKKTEILITARGEFVICKRGWS